MSEDLCRTLKWLRRAQVKKNCPMGSRPVYTRFELLEREPQISVGVSMWS